MMHDIQPSSVSTSSSSSVSASSVFASPSSVSTSSSSSSSSVSASPSSSSSLFSSGDYSTYRPLPDYVVDIHTARGSQKGMKRSQFADEGSFVSNLDTKFSNQEYEDYYKTQKYKQDDPQAKKSHKRKNSDAKEVKTSKPMEEDDEVDIEDDGMEKKKLKPVAKKSKVLVQPLKMWTDCASTIPANLFSYPVAQKCTSSWKQLVFLLPEQVIKGPYDVSQENVRERLKRSSERDDVFAQFGLNVLPKTFLKGDKTNEVWVSTQPLYSAKDYSEMKTVDYVDSCCKQVQG